MKQANSEAGWRHFLTLCNELETTRELDDVMSLFLTLEEKKDITDRFLIVKQLLEGQKTQREIAQELRVSIAKITRGSNSLKTIGKNLRSFLIKTIK